MVPWAVGFPSITLMSPVAAAALAAVIISRLLDGFCDHGNLWRLQEVSEGDHQMS